MNIMYAVVSKNDPRSFSHRCIEVQLVCYPEENGRNFFVHGNRIKNMCKNACILILLLHIFGLGNKTLLLCCPLFLEELYYIKLCRI